MIGACMNGMHKRAAKQKGGGRTIDQNELLREGREVDLNNLL